MSIPGVINFGAIPGGTAPLSDFDTSFNAVQTYIDAQTTAINGLKFGLVPNTGADMTSQAQAALDSGERVFVGPGTYNIQQILARVNSCELFGQRNATIFNCTNNSVFCAIGTVENFSDIYLHDFQLQGSVTTEGANPLRGIVNGVTADGTAHTAINYVAENIFERLHITGQTPGTNGFNVGFQTNTANYSQIIRCVIESIIGTNSGFGHGIVCNGVYQLVMRNYILSTVSGQGRHGIYLTNQPVSCKAIKNYLNGFQNEGITSNTSSPARDLLIDGNTLENCLLSATGTTAGVIDINAPFSKVVNNTITGTTTGSNMAGISVTNANYSVVSNNTVNGSREHSVLVYQSNYVEVSNNVLVNPDSGGTGNYGGVEIIQSVGCDASRNKIIGLSTYRFGVRFNLTSTISNNCQVFDNQITGSYSNDIENEFADPTNCVRRLINEPTTIIYTPGATSISLAQNVTTVKGISNSGPVTITTFPGAVVGQETELLFYDTNTTIARTNVTLAGGVAFVSSQNSTLTILCIVAGATPQFQEVSRAVSLS